MPNWVYNKLTVTGPHATLYEFIDQAGDPRVTDGEIQNRSELSFLNFMRPDGDELETYDTTGWYTWNITNWGCKWDAGEVEILHKSEREVIYTFTTPWSPPTEAFVAMVAQHPALGLFLEYNEEQGWGGELIGENGGVAQGETWEIPASHEEREGRFGSCICDAMTPDEIEYMYDDCPLKKEQVSA